MSQANAAETIAAARAAAVEVLLHNADGPFHGLPRTAGWGYPEPYTRDLMIAALGVLVSGQQSLIDQLRRVLETLASNQTPRGHVTSLVHDPKDVGASDTTPLFLLTTAIYRRFCGEDEFLVPAVERALSWMDHQSPNDDVMVAQQPTSDWRDEQWVPGHGLYVNAVVYGYLRLLRRDEKADRLRTLMNGLAVTGGIKQQHGPAGLMLRDRPHYALWAYKVFASERFDLLGNSLAVLTGVASPATSEAMVDWVEHECKAMTAAGRLAGELPPNLFPYIQPGEPEWHNRYQYFNQPGEYHNGGIWPFICGFYVAALVAAGRHELAERKLLALAELNRLRREADVAYGFNEWVHAWTATPRGQDWQSWSAAMFLYAAECVERRCTPFFDEIRQATWGRGTAQPAPRAS